MSNLLRRIFSRKTFVRLAFLFAALATLLVALVAIENRRGDRAWAAYRADAAKRGMPIERTAFLPPTVPDAENFAAIPLFQEIFAGPPQQSHQQPFQWPEVKGFAVHTDRVKGERLDLAACRDELIAGHLLAEPTDNPARDILAGLASFEPALQQLRDAARRPRCRFPVNWENGLMARLPHVATLQHATRLDAVRLRAHLALGDRAAALADWRDGFALYRALEHEPVLLTGIVRVAILDAMEAALWDGLDARQWEEPELRAIMADLGTLDLLADCRFALGSERCGMNGVVEDFVSQDPDERARVLNAAMGAEMNASPGGALTIWAYFRGWFRESQVKMNQLFDQRLAQIDPAAGRIAIGSVTDEAIVGLQHAGSLTRFRYQLASLLMPALDTAIGRYAFAHTTTQQARTACALELFRHVHDSFPERLEELLPDFLSALPRDVIDGAPMRYRRTPEGGFELWGIGLDQKDEGGKFVPGRGTNVHQPDWVWRS